MSDQEKLNKAREYYDRGEYPEARKLLEEITTENPTIRMNVLSAFIGVLDHVSENSRLLTVANEGIKIATNTGNEIMRNYFLGKKCFFLMSALSAMIYRQRNLVLSKNVFEWIDFSLQIDKKEYEKIVEMRKKLEEEIDSTLAIVFEGAESSTDHIFRGHQFSAIGDAYSSRYLEYKLDFQEGGKIRSRIANTYLVRRWNLDRFLYNRDIRRKIDEARNKCVQYFEISIKEFGLAGMKSEQAHSIYNLAAKLVLFNRFRRSGKLLKEARVMAESENIKPLLDKISNLEKVVKDRNRHIRDYVSEFGLDLP